MGQVGMKIFRGRAGHDTVASRIFNIHIHIHIRIHANANDLLWVGAGLCGVEEQATVQCGAVHYGAVYAIWWQYGALVTYFYERERYSTVQYSTLRRGIHLKPWCWIAG
jgi:hypothetical protein